MKRSFPACLQPLPIFSQKKRNRQPLISVPQKNEGFGFAPESVEFSSMPPADTDSMWGSRTYQVVNGAKKVDYRSSFWFGDENDSCTSAKDLNSYPKRHYGQMQMSDSSKGQANNHNYATQVNSSLQLSKQIPTSSSKRLQYSFAASSGSKPPYTFKNVKGKKDDAFDDMPEEEMVQAIPLYQITLKEKLNTLRIITASIESMKHWSQYTDQTPLLFEIFGIIAALLCVPSCVHSQSLPVSSVLTGHCASLRSTLVDWVYGLSPRLNDTWSYWFRSSFPCDGNVIVSRAAGAVLDSAVTSGSHGSKLFILKDGKNHVQCVFYEIDRDLPRLIRGRVHRAMGNYDKERNLLKCVSVRPASTAEQQTFTEFVTASSNEMEKYIRAMNTK